MIVLLALALSSALTTVSAQGLCQETAYQTCQSPPWRESTESAPGQPDAHTIELWPDTPVDRLSDGCRLALIVNDDKTVGGVGLAGQCTEQDRQARDDCLLYLQYLQLVFDETKRHWWLSEAAARCPWAKN
jgi:hypothetical protein